ncbi:MAG: hypothetical protein NZ807_02580 [Dehalococcoidia bacterium]|nr:hypothetical protein [Dehalococcoidia bacterium]
MKQQINAYPNWDKAKENIDRLNKTGWYVHQVAMGEKGWFDNHGFVVILRKGSPDQAD